MIGEDACNLVARAFTATDPAHVLAVDPVIDHFEELLEILDQGLHETAAEQPAIEA